MVVLFTDGFESGDLSAWDVGSTVTAIVATPVHSGVWAADMANAADYVEKTFAAQNIVYVRGYCRWSANPLAGNYIQTVGIYDSGNTRCAVRVYNDGGTIKWRIICLNDVFAFETVTFATPNPTINTWYSIEISWLRNTLNGCQLWVNGVSVGTITGTVCNVAVPTLSCSAQALPAFGHLYADDLVASTTYNGPMVGSASKRLLRNVGL